MSVILAHRKLKPEQNQRPSANLAYSTSLSNNKTKQTKGNLAQSEERLASTHSSHSVTNRRIRSSRSPLAHLSRRTEGWGMKSKEKEKEEEKSGEKNERLKKIVSQDYSSVLVFSMQGDLGLIVALETIVRLRA